MLLKVALVALLSISIVLISAGASMATVTTFKHEAKYGILIYVYYLDSSTVSSTTPSVNTAMTPPTGTGSQLLLVGESAYLWSTQFSSATTISSGKWLLDLWAESVLGGSFTVSIYVTNSAGTIQSTVVNAGTTGTIGTLTEAQVSTTFSGSQVSVPANGYIEVELTAPTVGAIELYWGAAQLTDFQVPKTVLS